MIQPVVDPHLSRKAQRFAPRAVVVIRDELIGPTAPARHYELHVPGQPPRDLGGSYGVALASLRVLQRAALKTLEAAR